MGAGTSPIFHRTEWCLTLKNSNMGSLAVILKPRSMKGIPKFFINMEIVESLHSLLQGGAVKTTDEEMWGPLVNAFLII